MGSLTGAVQWWEESQLRVLVLTSLLIQFFLFSIPILRRLVIPGWFRFIMWLAYHGGDAVAIYALATLFNRHKDKGDGSVGGGRSSSNMLLEVVWAPVLLIHLGGYDGVTAYNIEDNELWTRHLLTAVSQVTVAVYVFCKSWPRGGDKRLLQTAILLFTIGVVKCFMKAWAFKRASIYSLVTSADAAAKQTNDGSMYTNLDEYVKLARDDIVLRQQPKNDHQVMEDEVPVRTIVSRPWALVVMAMRPLALLFWLQRLSSSKDVAAEGSSKDVKITYALLCCTAVLEYNSITTVLMAVFLGKLAVPRDSFSGFFMEVIKANQRLFRLRYRGAWPQTVAQYSLAGYFVRNKKHNIKMGIVSFFQCKDFVDQLWCMAPLPCFTSARITYLVLQYLKDGWRQKIQDAATYRSFNNHSSHWGLNMNRPFDECVLLWHLATDFCFFSTSFPDHRCTIAEDPEVGAEILVPAGTCSQESADCKAVQCRHMSNYMVYLLFVNPEMLLPGTRRNIFKTAYDELKGILKDWECNPVCWRPYGVKLIEEEEIVMERLKTVMTEKRASQEESSKEATVTEIAIPVMQDKSERSSQEGSSEETTITEIAIPVTQEKPERSSQEGSSAEGSNRDKKFIDQAWDLAQRLLKKDENERWTEIQDVWVQMLCFSASRCRGYLHAKALGKGGEFLSYVWLLLFYMGMETFSERLQRDLLPKALHKHRHSASF